MNTRLKTIFFATFLSVLTLSVSAQKQIDQYNPEALYNKGVLLFENHHYGSAVEIFSQYLSLADDPQSQKTVDARFYEAAASLYLGNSDGEAKIIRFVSENPSSIWAPQANFLYANVLFKNKKYRDAIKVYESTDNDFLSEDEKTEYNFKKGFCYYQTDKIKEATPLFKNVASQSSPYQNDARYYYAHIQYINKNYDEAASYFDKIKDDKKYKNTVPLYTLQINYNKGDYAAVTDQADATLKMVEKRRKAELALIIAEAWFQQKDYAKSLEYYTIAEENTKRSFPRQVEFRIGFCRLKANDYDNAITHFQKAATKENDSLTQYASYYLAQCYTNTKEEKFARNAFLTAYKTDFNHTISEDALFNYAKLSFIPGVDPFNEAVNQLDEFINTHPESSRKQEAQEIIIHLLLNAKDYEKARITIEGYPSLNPELQKVYAQLTYNLGIQYYNDLNYDDAINYLDKTVNNNQATTMMKAEACYWLADSYNQNKDTRNAEKYYMQFIKMPAADQTSVYSSAHYNLGYIYFNKGDFSNAAKEFNSFINISKSEDKTYQSDAWMRIGDCYFMQRQYQQALTAYANAAKTDGKNGDYALYQQAMGYGALGNMKSKINCLDALNKNYPNSTFYDKAIYETGMAHLGSNDNRSAISAFNRLVKERPRSVLARQALMKIGMLYYNNDQYDNALTTLKQIVANYPNTDESREALNLIRNIYMETNRTQEFFKYTQENGIGEVSVTEQDSLSFKTAENFYAERKYPQAITALNQYISQYPNGAYLLDAHQFALISLEKSGKSEETRPHLEYIINQPDNDYTDNALLKIARMDYDAKEYEKAANYYERLINITENQGIKIEALEGSMKSNYFNNNLDKAIDLANRLSKIPELTQNQKNQLNYILGKSLFEKKDYTSALVALEDCARNDKSAIGAEAEYYLIVCYYNLKRYDDTENKVFHISDNFNSHTYWVARSFLILSDVYVAKDNIFQAKETLKSIIDNYQGEDLKKEAQQKLKAIETKEAKAGKENAE